MPMLIEHIDAIARKKGRDVLFLDFPQEDNEDSFPVSDWDTVPIRQQVIAWLNQHQIEWRECGHVANENVMCGYRGRIYIDVPFDTENPVVGYPSIYGNAVRQGCVGTEISSDDGALLRKLSGTANSRFSFLGLGLATSSRKDTGCMETHCSINL